MGPTPALSSWLGLSGERRSFGWALLSPAATLGAAVLTNAIASRILGIGGFGSFIVATSIASLLGVAMGMGMPATLVRYGAGITLTSARAQLFGLGWKAVGVSATVIGLLVLALDQAFPQATRQWLPAGSTIYVLAAAVGAMLVELAAAERQTSMHFFGFFLVNAGLALARMLGVVVALWLMPPTVTAAIIGYGAGSILVGVALAIATARRRPAAAAGSPTIHFRELLGFGLPIMGSAYIVAGIGYLDIVIVAEAMAREQLGLYGAGARLTVIQNTLIAGVTTLALPIAARSVVAGDVALFVQRSLRRGLSIGVFLTVVLSLASPIIVRVVYGAGYEVSASVYVILAVGYVLNFAGNPLSQLLYASKRSRFMLAMHIGQLVLLVTLLPFAAGYGGALAVAIAWSSVNLMAVGSIIARAVTIRAPAFQT